MRFARDPKPAAEAGRGMPYKYTVLTNTTLGVLMASSIVMISLPNIFRGIHAGCTRRAVWALRAVWLG